MRAPSRWSNVLESHRQRLPLVLGGDSQSLGSEMLPSARCCRTAAKRAATADNRFAPRGAKKDESFGDDALFGLLARSLANEGARLGCRG